MHHLTSNIAGILCGVGIILAIALMVLIHQFKKWQKNRTWEMHADKTPQTLTTPFTESAWDAIRKQMNPSTDQVTALLINNRKDHVKLLLQLGLHQQHPALLLAKKQTRGALDFEYRLPDNLTEHEINQYFYMLELNRIGIEYDWSLEHPWDRNFDYRTLYHETMKFLQNDIQATY